MRIPRSIFFLDMKQKKKSIPNANKPGRKDEHTAAIAEDQLRTTAVNPEEAR